MTEKVKTFESAWEAKDAWTDGRRSSKTRLARCRGSGWKRESKPEPREPRGSGAEKGLEADKPTVRLEVCGTRRVKECQTEGVVGCKAELDKEHERGVGTPGEEAGMTNQLELTRRDLMLSLRGSVERQAQHGLNRLKKPRAKGRDPRVEGQDPRVEGRGPRVGIRIEESLTRVGWVGRIPKRSLRTYIPIMVYRNIVGRISVMLIYEHSSTDGTCVSSRVRGLYKKCSLFEIEIVVYSL